MPIPVFVGIIHCEYPKQPDNIRRIESFVIVEVSAEEVLKTWKERRKELLKDEKYESVQIVGLHRKVPLSIPPDYIF